jgi:hypothetical protein
LVLNSKNDRAVVASSISISQKEYEKFCDQKSARHMRKNCNRILVDDAKSLINCNSYVVVSAKNSFAPRVAAKFSRQSEQVNEESGARVVSYEGGLN